MRCYIVTGATWPFRPTLWSNRSTAMKAAAKLRRVLRRDHGDRGNCGVTVSEASTDALLTIALCALDDVYNG